MKRSKKSLKKIARRVLDKFEDVREDLPNLHHKIMTIHGNLTSVFIPKMGVLDEGIQEQLALARKSSRFALHHESSYAIGIMVEKVPNTMSSTIYRVEYRWARFINDCIEDGVFLLCSYNFADRHGWNPLLELAPVSLSVDNVVPYIESTYPSLVDKVNSSFLMRGLIAGEEAGFWMEDDGCFSIPREQKKVVLPFLDNALLDRATHMTELFIEAGPTAPSHHLSILSPSIAFFLDLGGRFLVFALLEREPFHFTDSTRFAVYVYRLQIRKGNVYKSKKAIVISDVGDDGRNGLPHDSLPSDCIRSIIRDVRWFFDRNYTPSNSTEKSFVLTPMSEELLQKVLIDVS